MPSDSATKQARHRRVGEGIERDEYVTGARERAPVIASTGLIAAVMVALVLLPVGGGS